MLFQNLSLFYKEAVEAKNRNTKLSYYIICFDLLKLKT